MRSSPKTAHHLTVRLRCRTFCQPTEADFHIAKLTFHHAEWVLDLRPCLRFAVFDLAFDLVDQTALAGVLEVGKLIWLMGGSVRW